MKTRQNLGFTRQNFVLLVTVVAAVFSVAKACSNGQCKLLDECSMDADCEAGLYCGCCPQGFSGSRCIRSAITDQFKLLNNSLPFNKYAFLTTHNTFAIEGEPSHTGIPRVTFNNQEDTVTQQLNNGVRALMLDMYDFKDDVWLCHSFNGQCYDFTAFEPAIDTLKEVETFLSANPSEIVTLILEDYVEAPNGLTNVFNASGLKNYWFPVTSMPKNGHDWPLVSDMVANNQRLLVFTSKSAKEQSEGIAYQWNYMVENQSGCISTIIWLYLLVVTLSALLINYRYFEYTIVDMNSATFERGMYEGMSYVTTPNFADGDDGMKEGSCSNRGESSPLDDKTKSLVLVNYFASIPFKLESCENNSGNLINMLYTCHGAAANRWANFVAVDFYKRSEGGGSFQALDNLNGELLCGCNDVHACVPGSPPGSCQP